MFAIKPFPCSTPGNAENLSTTEVPKFFPACTIPPKKLFGSKGFP